MVPGACNDCTGSGNLWIDACHERIACGIEFPANNNQVKDTGSLLLLTFNGHTGHVFGRSGGDI